MEIECNINKFPLKTISKTKWKKIMQDIGGNKIAKNNINKYFNE